MSVSYLLLFLISVLIRCSKLLHAVELSNCQTCDCIQHVYETYFITDIDSRVHRK